MDLQTKLKSLEINESNCNHILECKKLVSNEKNECQLEEIDEKRKVDNGICNEELELNGLESSTPPPLLKKASQQTSEVKSKCTQFEVVKLTRELPDKSTEPIEITYKVYESESELPNIMKLIQKDLSEPYSIYTYRYFIHNWGHLCYLALHENKCVGCIVCKLDIHRQMIKRGYIAMLAVDSDYRKLKIGTTLVQKAIRVNLGKENLITKIYIFLF
jgi:N-alpha-acetyltransferase 30